MRASQYLLANLKELPSEAELVSHQLMMRAGMIRKLASGIMTWLPTGLRVLKKIENIIREEMNRSGALEIMMPAIQPAELWKETKRWELYGPTLLKMHDRHEREFCYGPTHEEVITDILRQELRSYRQLPLLVYQIQTKFRDEIRPRFGVMRAREFLMKDAYSFHLDRVSLQKTYEAMHQVYKAIFERLGLQFRVVEADSGEIGGNLSHEFQVLAKSGEDIIVYSDASDYAANLEKASAAPSVEDRPPATETLKKILTPECRSIDSVCQFLKVSAEHSIKLLIAKGWDKKIVAFVLRGDHELNLIKAVQHPSVKKPFEWASEEEIIKNIGCKSGYLGPVGLAEKGITVLADREAAGVANFCCGANEEDYHLLNVNWGRDVPEPIVLELRNVVEGDKSPDGNGSLKFARGIEVGHIFQLGDKYSQTMKLNVLNETGKSITLLMGCYGIGVSRLVAASIEQNHDEYGIIWPQNIAPFQIILLPLNYHKSHRVRLLAQKLYQDWTEAGYEVLIDDRKERPGILFATADLLGIPHRFVINESYIDNHEIEYQDRKTKTVRVLKQEGLSAFIKDLFV